MKAGDLVEPAPASICKPGHERRKITYVGKMWVLYDHSGMEQCMHRSKFEREFKVVEPFFEAGKTYGRAGGVLSNGLTVEVGLTFEVKLIEEDSTGQKVAFGKVTNNSLGQPITRWTCKRKDVFEYWQEVE